MSVTIAPAPGSASLASPCSQFGVNDGQVQDPPGAQDVRVRLRRLMDDDPQGAIWCAALCVQSVQPPTQPDWVAPVLRLVFQWAQGVKVSATRLKGLWDSHIPPSGLLDTTAASSLAAYYLAVIVCEGNQTYRTDDALDAAAYAQAATKTVGQRFTELTAFHQLILPQLHPLTSRDIPPSPFLDRLLEQGQGRPARSLGQALAVARMHRLRWWNPLDRWAVEQGLEALLCQFHKAGQL